MKSAAVLLVDDEEELVLTLQTRLGMRGIPALVAMGGDEALRIARETPIAVAVLDLKMPGLSGLEVRQALRGLYPDIRTILVTGHGSTDETQAEGSTEDGEILLKPFSLDSLVELIRTGLAERKGDRDDC